MLHQGPQFVDLSQGAPVPVLAAHEGRAAVDHEELGVLHAAPGRTGVQEAHLGAGSHLVADAHAVGRAGRVLEEIDLVAILIEEDQTIGVLIVDLEGVLVKEDLKEVLEMGQKELTINQEENLETDQEKLMEDQAKDLEMDQKELTINQENILEKESLKGKVLATTLIERKKAN